MRRDLGVVLGEMRGGAGASKAVPLLQEAIKARPGDLHAREALATVLGRVRGRANEGLANLEAVLTMAPNRESTLVAAALLADQQQRREESIGYMQARPSPSIPGVRSTMRRWPTSSPGADSGKKPRRPPRALFVLTLSILRRVRS